MPVHKIDPSLNNSLQTFLKSHGTDGGSFTHTSIGNPKGSYSIPNTDINEFMSAYTRVAFEENIPVHLTEGIKDCEYTPLKIDIDFRYYKNNLERIYELDDIINGQHPQYQSNKLRKRLLSDGLKENKCEICDASTWLDKPLKLELHHVDGNRNNNFIDNIQLLCPNCHSYTDNYKGKNIRKMVDIKPDM